MAKKCPLPNKPSEPETSDTVVETQPETPAAPELYWKSYRCVFKHGDAIGKNAMTVIVPSNWTAQEMNADNVFGHTNILVLDERSTLANPKYVDPS